MRYNNDKDYLKFLFKGLPTDNIIGWENCAYSLFMCQDEHEREGEQVRYGY